MSHVGPGGKSGTSGSHSLSDSFPSGHTTASGKRVKLCCICGEDLVGKERLKDHEGKYWCPNCAREDAIRKQPAACPECNAQLTRGDLVNFEGKQVCKVCAEKLRLSAKRAAARVAAAQEEARLQAQRHRRILIGVGVAVTAAVVYAVVRVMT